MPFSTRKKIIFLLIIFLFLFFLTNFTLAKECESDTDCPGYKQKTTRCLETESGEKECVRVLETVYPKIAGEELTTEKVVKEGLPGYVKYIFTVAVGIIGLIILGVLIYNGFLYLSSAGRPEQMSEARKGILAGLLGGIILLSAVLIFDTINPQLKIIKLPEVSSLEQVVMPGVYICNYTANGDELNKALEGYVNKTGKDQIEAVKELRKIMGKPGDEHVCQRVNFSGNFQNFEVRANNTIFIIPYVSRDPEKGVATAEYEYGIILHEKDNFGGKCSYYPKEGAAGSTNSFQIYHQIDGYQAQGLPFTARSVTLFQKPPAKPVGQGVTLYSCFNYNREGECGENIRVSEKSYSPGATDIIKVNPGDLGDLKENTRSITFSPNEQFLALLSEGEDFINGRCQLLHKNTPNLMGLPIGMCPSGCQLPLIGWFVTWITNKPCAPCLRSMIVLKGNAL